MMKMKSSEIEKIQPVGTTWNRVLNSPSGTMRSSNTCTCISMGANKYFKKRSKLRLLAQCSYFVLDKISCPHTWCRCCFSLFTSDMNFLGYTDQRSGSGRMTSTPVNHYSFSLWAQQINNHIDTKYYPTQDMVHVLYFVQTETQKSSFRNLATEKAWKRLGKNSCDHFLLLATCTN